MFEDYLTIIEPADIPNHFGAKTFMVASSPRAKTRTNSMMALLERMSPGPVGQAVLVQAHSRLHLIRNICSRDGHMLTEPWKRVGFPIST